MLPVVRPAVGNVIGPLLRGHRRAAGWSIEALAAASGVSVRTIGDLERGRARAPHEATVTALADGLRLAGDDRDALLAAARAARLPPTPDVPGACDLPADVPDFVGRAAELARLTELADPAKRQRLVVVSGPGGVGKSTVTVHAAHELARAYRGGVRHVDLHGTDHAALEPHHVLGRLLASLGVREIPAGLDDRSLLYRRLLADHPVLVVLDNARAEAQVRPLLTGPGESTVLITSRRVLTGLEHATRIPLEPMALPDAVSMLVTAGAPADSESLLEDVARLCGRHPLALRIVANRLLTRPSWSLADMVRRLTDEDRRMATLVAGDLQVEAALALSYRQLDEHGRAVLRRLSLCRLGGAGPDIAAVLTDSSVPEAEDALDELVELSFLTSRPGGRVAFHDLVADFAAHRLKAEEDAPARADTAARLDRWLLASACRAGQTLHPQPEVAPAPPHRDFADVHEAARWLTVELANWMKAFRAAVEAGEDRLVTDVARCLRWFASRGNLWWPEWPELLRAAVAAADRLDDVALRAVFRGELASALNAHGLHAEVSTLVDEAMRLSAGSGDPGLEAEVLIQVSDAVHGEDSVELGRRALQLLDGSGEEELLLVARLATATAVMETGRLEEATAEIGRLVAALDVATDAVPHDVQLVLRLLACRIGASIHRSSGLLVAAAAGYTDALGVAEELQVPFGVARAHQALGEVALEQGDHDLALDHLGRAQQHFEAIGDLDGAARMRDAVAGLSHQPTPSDRPS